jgi:hypothetical protein
MQDRHNRLQRRKFWYNPHKTVLKIKGMRSILFMSISLAVFHGMECSAFESTWVAPPVLQLNGHSAPIELPAKSRLLTESWVRVATHPFLIYMPEKHRLLMLFSVDYVHQPAYMHSDDYGVSWSDPVYLQPANMRGTNAHELGVALSYLGNGRVIGEVASTKTTRWVSDDYGETWSILNVVEPTADGWAYYIWEPMLVQDSPDGHHVLIEPGNAQDNTTISGGHGRGYLRFSMDDGRTWPKQIRPPQWDHCNEFALCGARNGDLVAACRTDNIAKYYNDWDNYNGFGISISKDKGLTWSEVRKVYAWGRHQNSMVVLENGDIVMSYVVRRGYTDAPDGKPRFGIEAIVSKDNGQTWDLDHRYFLAVWSGARTRAQYPQNWWWAAPMNESSVLLPDGSIVTVFGTNFRNEQTRTQLGVQPVPRDIGMVRWRPNYKGLNSDRTLTDAPLESDLRNVVDPPSFGRLEGAK